MVENRVKLKQKQKYYFTANAYLMEENNMKEKKLLFPLRNECPFFMPPLTCPNYFNYTVSDNIKIMKKL